ncbi:hypothetical protein AN219_18255, partial [Streptomyces nanshensis]
MIVKMRRGARERDGRNARMLEPNNENESAAVESAKNAEDVQDTQDAQHTGTAEPQQPQAHAPDETGAPARAPEQEPEKEGPEAGSASPSDTLPPRRRRAA